MEQFLLITTIGIIIMISPMISNLIKMPVVVIEITLGIFAGYIGLLHDNEIFKIIAKFGFLYLMFLAGIEINLKLAKTLKQKLAFNVILYFVCLYTFAATVCYIFDLNLVYLVALPIFSLGMIMMLIKEYGKNEPWLNLALSIGVVGEVISILALTLFSGWLENGFSIKFLTSILIIVGVIATTILILRFAYILFWWFPELKKYIIPDIDRLDQDIRFSISLLLILAATMLLLKIDVVFGAFTAGLFLKIFFYEKHNLIEKIESFGFGFFVPIFFIYTGSTVKLDMLNLEIFQHALFIIITIIAIRLVSSFIAFYSYLKFKQVTLFAFSDSMPLTFMVAIAMLAYNYKLISQEDYFAFIIASMTNALVLMISIRTLYKFFKLEPPKLDKKRKIH